MGKVILRNTKNLLSIVNNPIKSLLAGATVGKEYILDNWEKGIGADGKKMPTLSKDYKDYKQKVYGRNKRDLLVTGALTQGMIVKSKKESALITFAESEKDKARSNADKASGMMKKGKGLIEVIREGITKYISNYIHK